MAETSKPRRRRWRGILLAAIVAALAIVSLLTYLRSDAFRERVRRELITQLEQVTGGNVELRNFTWNLSRLSFDIDDLTIHGLEKPSDAPYAHFDHAHVTLEIISVLKRSLGLQELSIQGATLHLIVHADGSTNQPRPKIAPSRGSPAEQLF